MCDRSRALGRGLGGITRTIPEADIWPTADVGSAAGGDDRAADRRGDDDSSELGPWRQGRRQLVLRGRHLGQPDRYAEIIEVLGEHGRPPYRVLLADGRIATYSPDSRSPSRVCVEHVGRATRL